MTIKKHNWIAIVALMVFGMLAMLHQWIGTRRPALSENNPSVEFSVTSQRDHGLGTLREAIYGADTAKGRVRIVFQVAYVELSGPLPPLVNPLGTIIDGNAKDVELDAHRVSLGPVLDVDSPNSVLRGVKIVNSPDDAILVRSNGFHLIDSKILRCDSGVQIADGITGVVIERTALEENRLGVQIGRNVSGILITRNQFTSQGEAGIWAVEGNLESYSSQDVRIRENVFERNHFGAVVSNISALIEGNEFRDSGEAAVFLMGSGATVRGNRIQGGVGAGIFADRTQRIVIEGNELDHNRTIGVLVRNSRNAVVSNNRAYRNGYGIAFVLGQPQSANLAAENTLISQLVDGIILIGDSPLLRHNLIRANQQAGLRILDFVSNTGERIASSPYLERNSLLGNGSDRPVSGEYRTEVQGKSK